MEKIISRVLAATLATSLIGSAFLSAPSMAQYRSFAPRPAYNTLYGPPPVLNWDPRSRLAPSIQEFYSSANGG
jgi:hypothetical protein